MTAHATAHVHAPPKWPAIEAHVESERRILGGPSVYMLKLDATERERNDVYNEICARWHGYQVNRCGRRISVWSCE